jgi:hypothetical protein
VDGIKILSHPPQKNWKDEKKIDKKVAWKKTKKSKIQNGALMRVEKCNALFNAPLVAWPAA